MCIFKIAIALKKKKITILIIFQYQTYITKSKLIISWGNKVKESEENF